MDIEDIIIKPKTAELTFEQNEILRNELIKNNFDSTFNFIKDIKKQYKFNCSKIDLIKIYIQYQLKH